jgi:hypothetical protein
VAEVTLNEAGKASTLTLAPGWTFEGSSGPFTLKNVEHGHQIVRGAVNPDAKRAPRATPAPRERKEGFDPSPRPSPSPEATERPAGPRGHAVLVYRTKLVSEKHNEEVTGWLRYDTDPEKGREPFTKAQLYERVWAQLKSYIRVGKPEDYQPEFKHWTNKDQAAARKNEESGSPWGSENHGD